MSLGQGISMPTEADLQHLPEDERLMQAAQAARAAASAQGLVETLRSKAAVLTDPKAREKMLSDAYDNEVQAKGLSKKARILKSGTFQGAAGGAGIGAATGIGLGTVVGTVVGTVASIPTTALGGLLGAGTGAIHGPWIKLGGGKKEDGGEGKEEEVVQVPQEAIESGAVQVDSATGHVTVKDPEALKQAASGTLGQAGKESAEQKKEMGSAGERRKPKKLEIRSNKQTPAAKTESPKGTDTKPKRKPPKLAPRSKEGK